MASREDRWIQKSTGQKTDRYGKGKRYRVHYKDPSGRHRSRSFTRASDADRFLVTVGADLARGDWLDPTLARLSLRSQADVKLSTYPEDSGRRAAMRQQLDRHILPSLGDIPVGVLSQRPSIISQFLARLDLSPGSRDQVLITLSSVFALAVKDGVISRNPCSGIERPKSAERKVVPWTADQVAAVRSELPCQYQAFADCGSLLGLRRGEIFGLGPDEVDFLRGVVHLVRQVKTFGGRLWLGPPKREKVRDVPLPESAAHALAAHQAAFPLIRVTLPWHQPNLPRLHGSPVTADLFFGSRSGGAVNPNTFHSEHWQPALVAAGMPRLGNGPHALRHHYASVLLASGNVSVKEVAEYLGHERAEITLRVYAHLVPSSPGRARKAIDDAFRAAAGEQITPDFSQGGQNGR